MLPLCGILLPRKRGPGSLIWGAQAAGKPSLGSGLTLARQPQSRAGAATLGSGRPFVHMGPRTLGRINATGLPGRRLCQGKPCFFPESLLPQWFRRDKRRQKQDKEPGDREVGSLAPFCAFPIFPPVSLARGGRAEGVCAGRGSRGLPGSHGPGMCSLLHFYHNNSLINSPAAAAVVAETCASEGVGHVALPEPREGSPLRTASPLPTLALPRHRKFLVLLCRCCKTCFWEVTFSKDGVRGLF